MRALRERLRDLVERHRPVTVRQVYYLAISTGLIEKDTGGSQSGYKLVGKSLLKLREEGDVPWEWVLDSSRRVERPISWSGPADLLRSAAAQFRLNPWEDQPVWADVWCESDSVAMTLRDVTERWRVTLRPCHGHPSAPFVRDAAAEYADIEQPLAILYVGDFDPTGLGIQTSLTERLARYGRGVGCRALPDIRRVGVTAEQVRAMGLQSHESNRNSARAHLLAFARECVQAGIPEESVEVEAMGPDVLRGLLDAEIAAVIDRAAWAATMEQEEEDRSRLAALADAWDAA